MPEFAILIDDGEYVASATDVVYPSILTAVADTLRTAAIIAGERAHLLVAEQRFVCEVQDSATRERRELVVRLDVQAGSMEPRRG